METAGGRLAKRSEARLPPAADGRSSALRSNETVGELGRRRLCGTSPNSRKSRRHSKRTSSSHLQGRDFSMEGISTVVGIDISKNSLDVHVLPAGNSFTVSNNPKGHQQLIRQLP